MGWSVIDIKMAFVTELDLGSEVIEPTGRNAGIVQHEYHIVVESIVACKYTDVSETTEDSVTSDGRGMMTNCPC